MDVLESLEPQRERDVAAAGRHRQMPRQRLDRDFDRDFDKDIDRDMVPNIGGHTARYWRSGGKYWRSGAKYWRLGAKCWRSHLQTLAVRTPNFGGLWDASNSKCLRLEDSFV